MTDFTDVGDFHRKFDLPTSDEFAGPVEVPEGLMDFRVRFMQEELDEFKEGLAENAEAKMFDALIDLVYVALGTAHLRGYPWVSGWNMVQEANMAKVRAAEDGSDSKRGSSFDVVKPAGWVPPDIEALLVHYGYGVCPGCERRLTRGGCWSPYLLRAKNRIWCSKEGRWITIGFPGS